MSLLLHDPSEAMVVGVPPLSEVVVMFAPATSACHVSSPKRTYVFESDAIELRDTVGVPTTLSALAPLGRSYVAFVPITSAAFGPVLGLQPPLQPGGVESLPRMLALPFAFTLPAVVTA